MKVSDFFKKNSKAPIISLEFVPPARGSSVEEIFKAVDYLMDFSPQFINVTNHPSKIEYREIEGKIVKIPLNKRPGTIGLCAAIKHRYEDVEIIPHLVCAGHSKYRLEDILIELNYLGIDNVFAIRGDPSFDGKFAADQEGWQYAKDLVKQISNMNQGIYLYPIENAVSTDFCIGVAGYPEKHYEALNIHDNIQHLKEKVEAGADYIITQMFFDFDVYKRFVELARENGIEVPIIPGIKPIVNMRSVRKIPKKFFVDIPQKLVSAMESAKTPKEEWEMGISYMAELVNKLLDYGVPGIHIFTMGRGKSTRALLEAVFGRKK